MKIKRRSPIFNKFTQEEEKKIEKYCSKEEILESLLQSGKINYRDYLILFDANINDYRWVYPKVSSGNITYRENAD